MLLLAADAAAVAAGVLGGLRVRLGERFGLIPEGVNELAWIVDWPLFEWNDGEGRWDALHHPFTSPAGELDPDDPGAARALAYDVIWNGVELGGGSIRISDPEVQRAVFEALGISDGGGRGPLRLPAGGASLRRAAARRHRLRARPLVALLHGTDSIRDVIAFPKAASGGDPLTGAPAPVDEQQLRELGIVELGARPAPRAGRARLAGAQPAQASAAQPAERWVMVWSLRGSSLFVRRSNCEPTQLPWESVSGGPWWAAR